MTDQELRALLLTHLEYSYLHDDWVFPLQDALDGITAGQAAWRPPQGMGIWDIVLHLTVWNHNIVERIETGKKTHPPQGPWPPVPSLPDEAAWQKAKQDLQESVDALITLVQTTPLEKIHASPYGLPDLLCRFTHLAYHLGQITKLRECQNW